ncbi:fibronectin type III domain-containing protein, partial [Actinoplanes sp. RD1]|uniref:fibronectin type III domain-containing protein n=1 Tax=Actinoplanes sp. RD1 TaxID=3064538 RepID=UPI0027404D23
IAAAAAIVAVTLPRGDAATPSAGTAGTAPPPEAASVPPRASVPAADEGAPDSVKIKDNRDSVSLTWRYPADADGPVLISGGRAGQEQRAFQQLAPGTAEYVVYGLNAQVDYCFTVAVVYGVDRVATSTPACTSR